MPIYEYRCEECGELTERLQRFDDPPLESCPECGGPVKKLISAPAFQFKGTGWYVTDYARSAGEGGSEGSGDKEKGAGGAESGSSSSSSSSSTDSGASETHSAGATRGKAEESPRKDSAGKGGEKGGKSAAANPA
jgi:putative FmdB family regulatory protein